MVRGAMRAYSHHLPTDNFPNAVQGWTLALPQDLDP
jgi:hypothetical protein